MCNQVQSVTLQTAILMQVQAFAKNNQSFSVHDITRTIREKTAQGELEIPEVEVSGASFRFDIPHAKVKELFDELRRTGVFDPEFSLARQLVGGMYFEYTPQLITGGNVSAQTPAPVTPVPTPVNVPVALSVTPVTNDITTRVQQYLTNCAARNFRPTLKNTQSAIKRGAVSTGVSCEDLKTIIQGLGYTVVDDPESISRAQVATV